MKLTSILYFIGFALVAYFAAVGAVYSAGLRVRTAEDLDRQRRLHRFALFIWALTLAAYLLR